MHRTSHRPAALDFAVPPSHPYIFGRGKDVGPSYPLAQYTSNYWEAPKRGGLRTPPADGMATTYPQSHYNGYPSHPESAYSNVEASSSKYTGSNWYHSSTTQPQYNSASHPYSTAPHAREAMDLRSVYRQASSPIPSNHPQALSQLSGSSQSKTNDTILPNLQIPPTINNSGGSLAEFAAQITCLFWFESMDTLQKAESLTSASSPIKRLRDDAIPSSGFRKWVVTILSTTQVTQNVILLALLFVYRLKAINPTVKGRSGSEYRLLTVALMLGNKFLDDNTYTNKTWAEVSGISVTEIHVMEVEFLSNMRYSLLASKEQWEEWLAKLGKFWTYCAATAKIPPVLFSPLQLSNGSPALPSPPASMQASPPSLPNPYSHSPAPYSHHQPWSAATSAAPVLSPLTSVPEQGQYASRKRSLTSDADEPPPKRASRLPPTAPIPYTAAAPSLCRDVPRLPVPNLTISTSQPMSSYPGSNGHSMSQNAPVLPPLNGRAMSSAYPTTPTYPPHFPMLTPTGPSSHSGTISAGGHGTPSRRQSPHSLHDLLALSSPSSSTFPATSGHASPSYFLQQRSSPYRPVRHVNTLLYPPPSASMHDYHANAHQMHYQPLGKRNEYHEGVVPEYAPRPGQNPYQHWNVTLPQLYFRH